MPETLELTYREALQMSMLECMEQDENVMILGEDIGRYQGTFKVTRDIFSKFGQKENQYNLTDPRHADHGGGILRVSPPARRWRACDRSWSS